MKRFSVVRCHAAVFALELLASFTLSRSFVTTSTTLKDALHRSAGLLQQGHPASSLEAPLVSGSAQPVSSLRTVMHSGRARSQNGGFKRGKGGKYFIDAGIQAKGTTETYFEETWGPLLKDRDNTNQRAQSSVSRMATTAAAPEIALGLDEIEEAPSDVEDQRSSTYVVVEKLKTRRPPEEKPQRRRESRNAVPSVPKEYESFAHCIADNIRTTLRQNFRRKRTSEEVKAMIEGIEGEVDRLIRRNKAGAAIFGSAEQPHAEAGYVWAVDVLGEEDHFRAGAPTFTASVALLHDGKPVLGLLDSPISKERWVGSVGAGTTLNGAPVRVLAEKSAPLEAATLYGSLAGLERVGGMEWAGAERALRRGGWVESGSEAYGCALVAAGMGHAALGGGLRLPALYALAAIVEGAGGQACDWHGHRVGERSRGRALVASSPHVARRILQHMAL